MSNVTLSFVKQHWATSMSTKDSSRCIFPRPILIFWNYCRLCLFWHHILCSPNNWVVQIEAYLKYFSLYSRWISSMFPSAMQWPVVVKWPQLYKFLIHPLIQSAICLKLQLSLRNLEPFDPVPSIMIMPTVSTNSILSDCKSDTTNRASSNMLTTTPGAVDCAGCGTPILDRFYLSAVDRHWHGSCLKCSQCKVDLQGEPSCFSRDGLIFCKADYYR